MGYDTLSTKVWDNVNKGVSVWLLLLLFDTDFFFFFL
jgi:hypothetical protein